MPYGAFSAPRTGLPADPHHPVPQMSAQQRKEAAFTGFVSQLEGPSAQQPVLLLCEDAHWLDPSSLELLTLLVEPRTLAMRPVFLSGLAEVQTMAGLFSEARQTLDAGIQAAEQTEERWANAELWRLRGASALAARGAAGAGEAAEYFRRAIDVVGQQESRLRGLRVATNLARLLADEGRIEAAREMLINALGPICGGADTPDPKEAHDLLRKGTSDLVRAP